MRIAVVILAGGEGSRIGGNKPRRMLGGTSLLDRALLYAEGLSGLRAVALRHPEQAENLTVPVVFDDSAVEGPLAGLLSALRFARDAAAEAALTIAADMPFLPPDLADRLEEALPHKRVAIARSGGHLHPVCGLWSIAALGLAADYLASGRRSLKGFAETAGYAAVDWPALPLDPFFNINSEQDLAHAERLLGKH